MTDWIAPPAAAAAAPTSTARCHWGLIAGLLLILSGCTAEPPPQAAAPPPPPPPVGWEPIPALTTDGMVTNGFVQERGLVTTGSVRRAWILLNLREAIPIPETGGQARSVRFVGEYRCAQRQWRPVEGAWFAQPNAQEPVHAERPRGGFRPAAAGTLDGAFLDAACGL